MKRTAKARGFTLVELMIVVVILGVIAVVLCSVFGIKFGAPHQRCRDEAGNDLRRYEECVRRENDDND